MYITIDYDESYKKGILKTENLEDIRQAFSEENENVNLIRKRYGKRFLPSRNYAITPTGRFDLGLFQDILKYLKSTGIEFKLILTESFKKQYDYRLGFENVNINKTITNFNITYSPRNYQEDCLNKMINKGRGLIEIATAGGKTPIFVFFSSIYLSQFPAKKIFIVTLPNLVKQTYEEFINNGFPKDLISMWDGNNELNSETNIVIASNVILYPQLDNVKLKLKKNLTLQKTIERRLSEGSEDSELYKHLEDLKYDAKLLKCQFEKQKNITHEFLKCIDLLLLDEVHLFKKGNEINELFEIITTKNIYGFTGSLPEKKIDLWNVIGKVGPIIHRTTREELIKEDHISDYIVKILGIEYKDSPDYQRIKITDNLTLNYELEMEFIINNEYRNKIIKKLIEPTKNNCLILVDKIAHGEKLLDILKFDNRKTYYIRGETDTEIREDIKKEIESANDVVLIAMSKIFSTGINLKNLHYIILAGGGKSKEKLVQSLGRGLRKHNKKEKLVFIDIFDFLKYGEEHFKERIRIYEEDKIKYEIKKIRECC